MFEVAKLREQFPALQHTRDGKKSIFFDGPAGTQVPQRAILAMVRYLSTCNANQQGLFSTSSESDYVIHTAHEWTENFLNAPAPEEIIFGQNMTSLTFHLSRSIGKTWQPGDEVLVTRLDHDANVSPWVLAAEDNGATVKWVDIHPEDCTLNMEDLQSQLSNKTKLLAVTAASNLVGTLTDIPAIARLAHDAGALVYVDGVHYAPHGIIDVQEWDCDFLACSAYKFFGPHLGILWGKRGLLEQLPAYKVRPAGDTLPSRWMTGTQNHEGLAGLTGTFDYLLDIGKGLFDRYIKSDVSRETPQGSLRRLQFQAAMMGIKEYERELALRLLNGLAEMPKIIVYGITAGDQIEKRVPTISLRHSEKSPEEIARYLGEREINTWNGHSYAINLTERLGVEGKGGVLRVGLVHYNTAEEVDILLTALKELK